MDTTDRRDETTYLGTESTTSQTQTQYNPSLAITTISPLIATATQTQVTTATTNSPLIATTTQTQVTTATTYSPLIATTTQTQVTTVTTYSPTAMNQPTVGLTTIHTPTHGHQHGDVSFNNLFLTLCQYSIFSLPVSNEYRSIYSLGFLRWKAWTKWSKCQRGCPQSANRFRYMFCRESQTTNVTEDCMYNFIGHHGSIGW